MAYRRSEKLGAFQWGPHGGAWVGHKKPTHPTPPCNPFHPPQLSLPPRPALSCPALPPALQFRPSSALSFPSLAHPPCPPLRPALRFRFISLARPATLQQKQMVVVKPQPRNDVINSCRFVDMPCLSFLYIRNAEGMAPGATTSPGTRCQASGARHIAPGTMCQAQSAK